jgi:hypothetical protein
MPSSTVVPRTPDGIPEPTLQATSQPTLQPTILPTDLPGSPPPLSPDPVFGELLPHVPEAIRGSCVGTEPLEPVLATVSCTAGDGEITVDYAQYPDRDSMYAAYNQHVRIAQIETSSGLCFDDHGGNIGATPGRWPAENSYSVEGQPAGRYLCLVEDAPFVWWTHDLLLILAGASAGAQSVDRLVTFWVNESGPVLE